MEKFEFKGTPGPWTVEKTDLCIYIGCKVNDIEHYVSSDHFCYPDFAQAGDPRKLANAHLIASAPLLLSSLIDLVFTAEKLWDLIKPIKDTDIMTATHPVIEEAKRAIESALNVTHVTDTNVADLQITQP